MEPTAPPTSSGSAVVMASAERAQANAGIKMYTGGGLPLSGLLKADEANRSTQCTTTLYQLAQGLMSLHAAGIVHGDLRAANIFVTSPDNGVALGGWTHAFDFNATRFRMLDDKPAAEAGVSICSSSIRWLAPECVAGNVPTPASDVYAFGMTIYEAMTEKEPYVGADDAAVREMKMAQAAVSGPYSASTPSTIPLNGDALARDVWSLIQDMTHTNPIVRPSMQIVMMSLRGLRGKASLPIKVAGQIPSPSIGGRVPRAESHMQLPSAIARSGTRHAVNPEQRGLAMRTGHAYSSTMFAASEASTAVKPLEYTPATVNTYQAQTNKVYPVTESPSPSAAGQPPTTKWTRGRIVLTKLVLGIFATVITIIIIAASSGRPLSTPTPTPTPTGLTPSASVSTLVEGFTSSALSAIAVASDNTIFVSDQTRVFKFKEGEYPLVHVGGLFLGHSNSCGTYAMFDGIRSMVVDQNGIVYIADANNRRVRSFPTWSTCVGDAIGTGALGWFDTYAWSARFDTPVGLAVDASNNVVITDFWGNNIRKFTSSTSWVSTVNSYVLNPQAIAVSPLGEIFVAQEHAILRADGESDSLHAFVGSSTAGYVDGWGTGAQFNTIAGIAVAPTGDALYVVDKGNHCIRKVELATNEVTSFAGMCQFPGHVDGVSYEAQFNEPQAIVIVPYGVMYVGEIASNSARVRKIIL